MNVGQAMNLICSPSRSTGVTSVWACLCSGMEILRAGRISAFGASDQFLHGCWPNLNMDSSEACNRWH
ncbi:Uncharacterised protein [Mycobacteroides abscessus subsp. abscessus]|nr:Uncharacterised protein [Mycobacteroides abscessus subsp. abscessus]